MKYALILLLGAMAMPLLAQTVPQPPDPSAEKESFVIQPGSVDAGATSVALRFVSNDAAGFSNSSSKPPSVEFSAGVTLVAGTFQILNQNEAQCTVDVDDEAVGTIEVSIELFSVNGSTTLNTLRATLGIKGQTQVTGSQAQVGSESVELIQVNVQDPQDAGVIVISGEVTGTVQITAPTGTTFAEEPVPTTSSGDINSPTLQTANTVFTFGIGNSQLDNVTVRVTNIRYNTAVFGLVGGVEGDLACEITGGALSNQVALVVNAFTAKTAIEGANDVVEEEPGANDPLSEGSESSDETDPAGTGAASSNVNTGDRNSRSLDGNRDNNRNDNRENRNGGSTRPSSSFGSGSARGTSGPNNPPPPPAIRNSGGSPAPAVRPSGGGGVSKVGGGASSGSGMSGTGSVTKEEAIDREMDDSAVAEEEPKVLEISPGLHFCDRDFNPLVAVVLDKQVADEAGGRVWIVLKLEKNKERNKVETVTVKLTVNGTARELILTETGKDTGEFRCSKEGVLLVANENPDSNSEDTAKKAPKPRVYR